MSPRVRAVVFIAITLAFWGLAAANLAVGRWLIGALYVVVGFVTAFFAYRSTHPRRPAGPAKPLRAPRPPR